MSNEEKSYLAFCNTQDADKKEFINIKIMSTNIINTVKEICTDNIILLNRNEIAIISDINTLIKIKNRFSFIEAQDVVLNDQNRKGIVFFTHGPQIHSTVNFFLGKKKS